MKLHVEARLEPPPSTPPTAAEFGAAAQDVVVDFESWQRGYMEAKGFEPSNLSAAERGILSMFLVYLNARNGQ